MEFHPILPRDRETFAPFLLTPDTLASHRSFANLYLWAAVYRQSWCLLDGWLLLQAGDGFYFPLGQGDLARPIQALTQYCAALDRPLTLWGLSPEEQQALEAACPGRFSFTPLRDAYDYLYTVERLSDLAGKKLHSKRNFINRFVAAFPDWRFEPITPENKHLALAMSREWCEKNGCDQSQELSEESGAIGRAFAHYQELGLVGGMLWAGERVVAYSLASPLGTQAMDVHIEKAFSDVDGAYPMINREMARYLASLFPAVRWLNREEDTGDEGLRRAKLSYHPDILLEKSRATAL